MARTFLRGPLRDQTHGELVYRPLQFHERSQHLIGTHDEALPVAMRVNNPILHPSSSSLLIAARTSKNAVGLSLGVHNKASSVLTLRGHNPKLSAFVIGT